MSIMFGYINQILFRGIIKEDRNDIKLLNSKAGEYKFIRLKNTKDIHDKDLSNVHGYYIVLNISATWIFLPQKQHFDDRYGQDYGNDYEELPSSSTTELNTFDDNMQNHNFLFFLVFFVFPVFFFRFF